jgi:hypothetical protein
VFGGGDDDAVMDGDSVAVAPTLAVLLLLRTLLGFQSFGFHGIEAAAAVVAVDVLVVVDDDDV